MADAMSDVLGVAEKYGGMPDQTRAVALMDPQTPSKSLDILGRCDRKESCESATTISGLPQKLHLFNGELLNARINSPDGRLDKWIRLGKSAEKIIRDYYRLALGRSPSEIEMQHWRVQLKKDDSAKGQRAFLEDFVWALLTSKEFGTNH